MAVETSIESTLFDFLRSRWKLGKLMEDKGMDSSVPRSDVVFEVEITKFRRDFPGVG